jgi:hypothetical protein
VLILFGELRRIHSFAGITSEDELEVKEDAQRRGTALGWKKGMSMPQF